MTEFADESNILWLRVVTPERVTLEARVQWVQAPTEDGLLGIWPLHIALIDSLVPGHIEYEAEDGIHREWINGGLLSVRPGRVIVLTGSAEEFVPATASVDAWDAAVQEAAWAMGEPAIETEQVTPPASEATI